VQRRRRATGGIELVFFIGIQGSSLYFWLCFWVFL
jgi:hypothetical protein